MKIILCFLLSTLICSVGTKAQNIGIGTGSPQTSAQLDVFSTNRGLLIPRLVLNNVFDAAPVTSPAEGLLVWNSNAAVSSGQGVGFYYWAGNHWKSWQEVPKAGCFQATAE